MNKATSKIMAMLLVLLTIISVIPLNAFAASIEYDPDRLENDDYYKLISKKDQTLAPGIEETEVVLNNEDGSHRQVVHSVKVDMNNPYTKVIPGYKGMIPNPDNYGTESTSTQAKNAEALGYGNVVAAIMFTLAKVLDMSWDFFKESCIVLLLGFITNAIAYIVFKSPQSISYASLLVMIIWFVISGSKLKSKTSVGVQHELFYLITVSAGFIAVTGIIKGYIRGFFIFALWLVLWTAVFYRHEIKRFLSAVKRKITEK